MDVKTGQPAIFL